MKVMKKDVEKVPNLIKDGKIKGEKATEKQMQTQEFVMKLQKEILDTTNQIIAIEGILEQIEEEELDQYFSPGQKNELSNVLNLLSKKIKPAIDRIEKHVEKWRK